MPLIFKISLPPLLEREQFERKLKFTEFFQNFIDRFFQPLKVQLWLNAPLEALGGVLTIEGRSLDEIFSAVHEIEDYDKSVVRIEGIFKLEEGLKVPAHLTLFNNELKKIYGDVEFDVYHLGDIEDISDIILESADFRTTLEHFFKEAISFKEAKIEKCVAGFTLDTLIDMRERVVLYSSAPPSFFEDLLRVLKLTAREEELGILLSHITPYKESVLARRVWSLREFQSFLSKKMKKAEIEMNVETSILLMAKNKDSFRSLYDDLFEGILLPAFRELPSDEEITGVFKRVAGHMEEISPKRKLREKN